MNFSFVIPFLDELSQQGVDNFLNSPHSSPDHALFAARWYYAAKRGNIPLVKIEECFGEGFLFLADYFYLFNPSYSRLVFPPNCVFFSAWSKWINRKYAAANNAYIVNHLGSFSTNNMYHHSVLDAVNSPGMIVVPLGGMQQYCQHKKFHDKRIIFLDEPHRLVLDQYDRDDLQHVFSYKKALAVSHLLYQRGYEIVTFCSSTNSSFEKVIKTHPHLKILHYGSRVNYFKLLDWYRETSIFWSHHQETHGYPVYENLQMGNPVISFSENFNILTTRQFQNSVVLSLYFSDYLCVELIDEFFNSFNFIKSQAIQNESAANFSADTFAERLKSALTKFKL